ncbi:hypothetical protein [Pseudoalteromonas 'SMAR']|uniref:hypothetical protein n=1 Tax=Pseudoalteromonas 'SMAR' TaxID=3416908 RepID=UPI003AF27728
MSNFIANIEKALQALQVSHSTTHAVLKHAEGMAGSTSSVFIETTSGLPERVDITTCHHYSRDWQSLRLDPSKLERINGLDAKFRPKTIWLEHDNIASEYAKPGLHLSVNQQTVANLTSLCTTLFNSQPPIAADDFTQLLSLAEIQHLSNLYREHGETLKLHLKPFKLDDFAANAGFTAFIKQEKALEVINKIGKLEGHFFEYVYLDLSFYAQQPLHKVGIYLSNKQANNKDYLNDFQTILAALNLTDNDISALVPLLSNNEHAFVDIKIVITEHQLYSKLYTGVINNKAAETTAIASQLAALFKVS